MNTSHDDNITIRTAGAGEQEAIERLAMLDSAKAPASPVLVAEVDGELQAALSLSDGRVVADPFRRTLHLLELMRAHPAAKAPVADRRHAPRVIHAPRFARI